MRRIDLKLIVTVGLSLAGIVESEKLQQLKVIPRSAGGTNPNSVFAQYNATADGAIPEDWKDVGSTFENVIGVCVNGMWALYSNVNFGEGSEGNTTVISIKYNDLENCVGNVSALNNVQSLRYLGNPDRESDGISIFTSPSFLGGLLTIKKGDTFPPAMSSVSGIPLGSIAITGSATKWRICEDLACTLNVVCVDMSLQTAGMFILRNAQTDKIIWPKNVRAVKPADAKGCAKKDRRPATPLFVGAGASRSNLPGKGKPNKSPDVVVQ